MCGADTQATFHIRANKRSITLFLPSTKTSTSDSVWVTFSTFHPSSAKLRPPHPRHSHSQWVGQDSETPSIFLRPHTGPAWPAACTCSSRCTRCGRSVIRRHERHKLAIGFDVTASSGENIAKLIMLGHAMDEVLMRKPDRPGFMQQRLSQRRVSAGAVPFARRDPSLFHPILEPALPP